MQTGPERVNALNFDESLNSGLIAQYVRTYNSRYFDESLNSYSPAGENESTTGEILMNH